MAKTPNGWNKDKEKLVLELKLDDFKQVIKTVNKIAEITEELNHHPDIEIKNYNELRVTTTTHSESILTDKDYELANRINSVTAQY